MVRKHIIVTGRVQGVGFRYICSGIANECHVTGWIKNKYDGSVEMEVQGLEHRVDRFIETVRSGAKNRFARVEKMQITTIPNINVMDEKRFSVKY